jgi:hypothetical protein
MEQVIDQFIREEREGGNENHSAAPAPDAADRLPRIVTSSLPIRPPALPGDDHWRRQFIGALRDVDDGAPMTPVHPPPLMLYKNTAPAERPREAVEHGPVQRSGWPQLGADPSPFAAGWCTTRRVVVAAVATVCVFSTGVLWATHRAETPLEADGPPTEVVTLASPTDAVLSPSQPIRNTPVLVREGEARTLVPGSAGAGGRQVPPASAPTEPDGATAAILPRVINGGEAPQSFPAAPVVRVVPVEPIVAAAPASAAVAAGPSNADAAVREATPPPSLPLDRGGLTDLAARPATARDETPVPSAEPATKRRQAALDGRPNHRGNAARGAPAARTPNATTPSRPAAPKVARGYVPAEGWEMRRQGLRIPPEPEPSTLKKLIGMVWPFGKSSTESEPAKPVAPAVTARPFLWSDDARARP